MPICFARMKVRVFFCIHCLSASPSSLCFIYQTIFSVNCWSLRHSPICLNLQNLLLLKKLGWNLERGNIYCYHFLKLWYGLNVNRTKQWNVVNYFLLFLLFCFYAFFCQRNSTHGNFPLGCSPTNMNEMGRKVKHYLSELKP